MSKSSFVLKVLSQQLPIKAFMTAKWRCLEVWVHGDVIFHLACFAERPSEQN